MNITGYAIEFICFNLILTIFFVMSSISNKIVKVGIGGNSKTLYVDLYILSGWVFYILISVFRKIEIGFTTTMDPVYYARLFSRANVGLIEYLGSSSEEYGFKLLLWIVRVFTSDYRICLFVLHSIAYFGMTYYIRKTRPQKISVFSFIYIFLCSSFLLYMFNITRSALAIIFASCMFIKLKERKMKQAFVLMIISIGMHNSALILLLVYVFIAIFMKNEDDLPTTRTYIIYFVATIIGIYIALSILLRFIGGTRYYSYGNEQGISTRTYLVTGIVLLLAWSFSKHRSSYSGQQYAIMLSFMLCCIPIQLQFSIAYRMTLLFFPLMYKCMLDLIEASSVFYERKLTLRMLISWAVIVFYFIYKSYDTFFVGFQNVYPYANDLLPFLNI